MASRWGEWGSPLRPSPEDVERFIGEIQPSRRNLLLGATPELQKLVRMSVDSDVGALRTHTIAGFVANWRNLPFRDETFDAVLGDGSLNVFEGDPSELFRESKRVLKCDGRLVLRVFVAPPTRQSLRQVIADCDHTNFHAFKWRVAHALSNPYVPVSTIYETVKPIWDHPTLEVYRNSKAVYYFPRLVDLPRWDRIQYSSSYELAERCPIVTWIC